MLLLDGPTCAQDIKLLRAMQRRVLISTTGAHCTTSFDSLCVASGTIPIDILLEERRALYKIRTGEDATIGTITIRKNNKEAKKIINQETIKIWQEEWESSTKGRVTFAFFGGILERLATQ